MGNDSSRRAGHRATQSVAITGSPSGVLAFIRERTKVPKLRQRVDTSFDPIPPTLTRHRTTAAKTVTTTHTTLVHSLFFSPRTIGYLWCYLSHSFLAHELQLATNGSYPGGSDTKAESRTGERTTDSGLRKRILVLIDEIQGLNTNL